MCTASMIAWLPEAHADAAVETRSAPNITARAGPAKSQNQGSTCKTASGCAAIARRRATRSRLSVESGEPQTPRVSGPRASIAVEPTPDIPEDPIVVSEQDVELDVPDDWAPSEWVAPTDFLLDEESSELAAMDVPTFGGGWGDDELGFEDEEDEMEEL